jgi:hypothetical protein
MHRGKDEPIKATDSVDIEAAFSQHTEVQPPREVTNAVEVMKANDIESGVDQLSRQFSSGVAAVMSKVLVNRSIDLGPRRDEEAKEPLRRREEIPVFRQLRLVVMNVFQHINAENCITGGTSSEVGDGSLDELFVRQPGPERPTESRIGLDRGEAFQIRQPLKPGGNLSNPCANFDDLSLQVRGELLDQRRPVIAGLAQCGELEIAG